MHFQIHHGALRQLIARCDGHRHISLTNELLQAETDALQLFLTKAKKFVADTNEDDAASQLSSTLVQEGQSSEDDLPADEDFQEAPTEPGKLQSGEENALDSSQSKKMSPHQVRFALDE